MRVISAYSNGDYNSAINSSCLLIVHKRFFKTILQDTIGAGVGVGVGERSSGRRKKCWLDNEKEWISLHIPELFTMASHREDSNGISAESSIMSLLPLPIPRLPNRSRD